MTRVTLKDLLVVIERAVKKAGDNKILVRIIKNVVYAIMANETAVQRLIQVNSDKDLFVDVMNAMDTPFVSYLKLSSILIDYNLLLFEEAPFNFIYFEMECDERERTLFVLSLLKDAQNYLSTKRNFLYSLLEDLLGRSSTFVKFARSKKIWMAGSTNSNNVSRDNNCMFFLVFHIAKLMIYNDFSLTKNINFKILKYPTIDFNYLQPTADSRINSITIRTPFSISSFYITDSVEPDNFNTLLIICKPNGAYRFY